MKNATVLLNKNPNIHVTSALINCFDVPFKQCFSTSADYIRDIFKTHERNKVIILKGRVEGPWGIETFESYDELYLFLELYENGFIHV